MLAIEASGRDDDEQPDPDIAAPGVTGSDPFDDWDAF